jgi:hypothetical protein
MMLLMVTTVLPVDDDGRTVIVHMMLLKTYLLLMMVLLRLDLHLMICCVLVAVPLIFLQTTPRYWCDCCCDDVAGD